MERRVRAAILTQRPHGHFQPTPLHIVLRVRNPTGEAAISRAGPATVDLRTQSHPPPPDRSISSVGALLAEISGPARPLVAFWLFLLLCCGKVWQL